jgi:sodium transport system ATP-binding protein
MIDVCELTKRFPLSGGSMLTAVDHLSFRVAPGEVYGLLGPNGAGKTTTVRMLLGLMRPDDGFAEIAGFRSSQQPDEVKRRVGLVAAGAGIYQWLTAREMLGFFADLYDVPRELAAERIDELSRRFDFRSVLERRCATLSTGQRQRVTLARALVHDPVVMLLDEPSLGLDVLGSQAVAEYIVELRAAGKAVILTTHRLDEAERICDRIGLVSAGRMCAEGTLDDLRRMTGKQSLVDMFLELARQPPHLEPAESDSTL